jgi:alkylation response protein AidB-like acyl-CoA dehydrogenase
VRVQRALGSRSPSLALATTMHHFSAATLRASGQDALLERVARERLYLASAFAEGRTGSSVLSSQLRVESVPGGLVVSGSKKPCSLARSMDFLTASVVLPGGLPPRLALLVLPADTPGISRRPFWNNWVLAGAESEEVVLEGVFVPEDRLVPWTSAADVQEQGFLWFELLVTASYLGAGSALVERVLREQRGTAAERVLLGVELESAVAALEGVARAAMAGEQGQDLRARLLLVRYAAQQALERATAHAVELLGGTAFGSSAETTCLLASARALAFHPPGRLSVAPALDAYLAGRPTEL